MMGSPDMRKLRGPGWERNAFAYAESKAPMSNPGEMGGMTGKGQMPGHRLGYVATGRQ